MRNLVLFSLLFPLLLFSCKKNPQENGSKGSPSGTSPNIILIMTDDQGYGDLGFHGNPDIQTPVLDRFAKESTRFTHFYVSPVCAPTRSSLMTGRYSLRTGVFDTYNGGAMMSPEEVTLAEYLKEAGYATGMFGKWHLGDNYPSRPHDQGFDHALYHRAGGMEQVGDITSWFKGDKAYDDPELMENGKLVQKTGYISDVITTEAMDFISREQDNPFFVYLAFNAPHTPLYLPEKYEQMYAGMEIDSIRYPKSERPFPRMSQRNKRDAALVYGMVTNIDDNIGRLMELINKQGLDDNTLVIFLTDNGPQQVRYVGGFRGRKGSAYEGGVRVPFFMRFPGAFPQDKEITIPAAHYDLVPTILDLVGLEPPANADGKSLMPLIKGEDASWPDRSLYIHWQRGFSEPWWNTAIRKGNYKLMGHKAGYDAKDSELELYNLVSDPGEMHNLASEKPDVVKDLRADFESWHGDMMRSKHLGESRIILGSPHENPSILSRNDAGGSWGIWAQDKIYGFWDVEVERSGYYDLTCHFQDTVSSAGRMSMRLGKTQVSTEIEANYHKAISLQKVWLEKGPGRLEAGFRSYEDWQVYFPFYVEVSWE